MIKTIALITAASGIGAAVGIGILIFTLIFSDDSIEDF